MWYWYVLEIRKVAVAIPALPIATIEDLCLTSGTKTRLSYTENSSVCWYCLIFILTNTAAQPRALTGSLKSGAVKEWGSTNVRVVVDMLLRFELLPFFQNLGGSLFIGLGTAASQRAATETGQSCRLEYGEQSVQEGNQCLMGRCA